MFHQIAKNFHLSSWEYLRRLGRSPVFGSIIFFPVVSAVISIHWKFVDIPLLGIGFDTSGYQIAKIYLLYFGFAFLFFGSVVFSYYCPEFMKRYDNSIQYLDAEMSAMRCLPTIRMIHRFVKKRQLKHQNDIAKLDLSSVERLNIAVDDIEVLVSTGQNPDDDRVSELMLAHWEFMSRAFPRARAIIYLLYVIGLCLLSLVTLMGIVETIWMAYNAL